MLADQPVFVVTRFSFLGTSDWKSEPSRDQNLLFAETRLRRRFALFEAIALPSLRAQTDQNFHHVVLTSSLLPEWALERLVAICTREREAHPVTVLARPPAPARKHLRKYFREVASAEHVVHLNLDDDDALAVGYFADLRQRVARLEEEAADGFDERPRLVSYPRGYCLAFDRGVPSKVYKFLHPFANVGLAMIAPAGGRNIFAIAHQAAGPPLWRDLDPGQSNVPAQPSPRQ